MDKATITPKPKIASSVEDVGVILRQARKSLKLSTQKAAASIGVSPRFYNQLENGKETVQAGKLLQVLSEMGLAVIVVSKASAEQAVARIGEQDLDE